MRGVESIRNLAPKKTEPRRITKEVNEEEGGGGE
jgi:hypothetical protein